MTRIFKRTDVVAQRSRAEMRCPHCGHGEFRAVAGKFSWLFGQRFVCLKCEGTFKRANLVKINKKEKHFRAEQTGGARRPRGRKRR
ncbi:MAG: hypothetical protein R6V59_02700 [Dehalococcoidia bacterium]